LNPTVDCVAQRGPGEYTAVFGYTNSASSTVIVPIGGNNEFTQPAGTPAGRGQPVAFQTGTQHGAFVVDFDGNSLTWTLGAESATASSASPACTTTQGPNGPTTSFGSGPPILLWPDPGAILPGTLLDTEVGANGFATGELPGSFHVTSDGASTYEIPI